MVRKFFPYDKNYLLERAQLELERSLIPRMIDLVKFHYLQNKNPLGLVDDTTQQIMEHTSAYVGELREFYRSLAAVYRYKHGDNQLEFIFDGREHLCKYREDWENTFLAWIEEMCFSDLFCRAVLELSVFYPKNRKAELAANRMQHYLHQHFSLKIYKYKGIIEMNVA